MTIPHITCSLHPDILSDACAFSDVFIETGTCVGGGVSAALSAGFNKVYSVEISEELFSLAAKKFCSDYRVVLRCGNSASILPDFLQCEKRAVIFLDAHDPESPLRQELEAIANNPGDWAILVDDIDVLYLSEMGSMTLDELKSLLLKIRPDYSFRIMNGNRPSSLLCAFPPTK